MPAPTSYTEATFKSAFLHKTLSHTANALGWDPAAGDYDEVVNETLLAIGESDVADVGAGDIRKLRALGRLFLWRAVADATAGDYAFSADGGSYSRDQVHAHALTMLERAKSEAAPYDPDYAVEVVEAGYHRDPYADHDDVLTAAIDAL